MGDDGLYTHTFSYEKNPNCMVCGSSVCQLTVPRTWTLQQLMDKLGQDPQYQLKKPSMTAAENIVFIQNPAVLREAHEYKLEQTLDKLVQDKVFQENSDLIVTDPAIQTSLILRVRFTKDESGSPRSSMMSLA